MDTLRHFFSVSFLNDFIIEFVFNVNNKGTGSGNVILLFWDFEKHFGSWTFVKVIKTSVLLIAAFLYLPFPSVTGQFYFDSFLLTTNRNTFQGSFCKIQRKLLALLHL